MVIGGNITTNINETYSGNKVMAAYGLQERQEKDFVTQVWNSFDVNMSLTKRAGWMSPIMYLIASVAVPLNASAAAFKLPKNLFIDFKWLLESCNSNS